MENHRIDIIKKFWDRSSSLSVKNRDYEEYVKKFMAERLKEDSADNDITAKSLLIKPKKAKAVVVAKESGIVAGIEEISLLPGIEIGIHKSDGSHIVEGDKIITIEGDSTTILSYERTLLNLLQRMSGIATAAHGLKTKIGNKCLVLGTRKTILNLFDKKALAIGGALTHRLSLDDGILIKDNYLNVLGNNIKKALESAVQNSPVNNIEIEIETPEDAVKAVEIISIIKCEKKNRIKNKNFAILLDNMSTQTIQQLIKTIKEKGLYNDILFEASGNITEKNIQEYAESGVDAVSVGALTHSVKALNISLEIEEF